MKLHDILPLNSRHLLLESCVLMLILYSIVIQIVELEIPQTEHHPFMVWSERLVAIVFTIEYLTRWWISRSWTYPLRLIALIDLLAILPFYLGFWIDLRSLRVLRAIRAFRFFKLYRYTNAMESIQRACHSVRYEFGVIGFAVLTLAWVGSITIYEAERYVQPETFGRLSDAAWYTAVTLTTVGYGDKVPVTSAGRMISIVIMITGLGLFGAFVSLVGSAFLEELRRSPRSNGTPVTLANFVDDNPDHFDPVEVLHLIEQNHLSGRSDRHTRDLERLLATACHRLIAIAEEKQIPH